MIPIHQAISRTIKCPQCGAPSLALPSKKRVASGPNAPIIMTANAWCMVDCPRTGKKLYRAETPVEVIES
jgi:hypothetical protein